MPNDYILRFIIHRYRDLTRKVKSKYYEKSACNCEGTEQLRKKILDGKRELGICLNVKISQDVIKIVVDFWEKGTIIIGMEA